MRKRMRKRHKLFISHKYDDRSITDVVAWLVDKYRNADVEIHHSSNSAYLGPKPNDHLDSAILKQLSEADGFLLVYTTSEADWSYCMYEYGVVSNPKTPDTNCFVLQCTSDKPTVLSDHVRIDARKLDDIRRFVRYFFCETPFPTQTAPFCNWNDGTIEEVSKEFFDRLQNAIQSKKKIIWTNWPSLKITFSASDINDLTGQTLLEKIDRIDALLRHKCYVLQASYDCSAFFGYRTTSDRSLFGELINSWQNEIKQSPDHWLKDLSTQIVRMLDHRVGVISRAPLISCSDRQRLQMLCTQATKDEVLDIHEFQILLLDFSDPRSVIAGDIMIPIEHAFYKVLWGAEKMYLIKLLDEMHFEGRKRIVFIWQDRTPAYVVESDVINRFLVKVTLGSKADLSTLTMDNLLHDNEMDEIIKKSFAVASPSTTLADVREVMHKHDRDCRYVFITPNGVFGEKALGLLTDDAIRTV